MIFSKIWNVLSGRKRTIACVYWAVVIPSLLIIWPDGYHTHFAIVFSKVCSIFGLVLTYLGLGHAASKVWMPGTSEVQVDEQIAKEESEAPVVETKQQEVTDATTEAPKTETVDVKPQEPTDAISEVKKNS